MTFETAKPQRLSARWGELARRLGAALLALSLCLTPAWSQRPQTGLLLPALGDEDGLTLAAERQIGDRIIRELYRDPDHLEDPVLDDYIARLWSPLLEAASQRGELTPELRERFAWRILLGKDRSINAFALPGGYLGVHLGLIAAVTTRDELASVLAHELIHVTQRHIARSVQAQERMAPWLIGAMVLAVLAASKNPQGSQAAIVGGQAAAVQSQLSYSRDMEREADRIGFGVLSQAGYDPQGFVSMFGKLQQAAALNDSGAYPYLRSHPLTTERIADMHSRLPLASQTQTTTPPASTSAAAPAPAPATAPAPAQQHQHAHANLHPQPAAAAAPQDMELAMIAARARVLSQSQVDSLRAWTQLPLQRHLSPAQQAGALYAAALAHQALQQAPQALQHWQSLQTLSANDRAGARQSRLLGAQLLTAQGQHEQALRLLQSSAAQGGHWPRPELMALAHTLSQSLPQPLPQARPASSAAALAPALLPQVTEQLRQLVQHTPHDAQAWRMLAALLHTQGHALAALRAQGEAQIAVLDWSGALDRFMAAQDWAARRPLQAGEHIEAAIVDSRLRQVRETLRELQKER